jgi:cytochrome c oxidase subunit 4
MAAHAESVQHHIVPRTTYYTIYVILMACTFLTYWVSTIELGALNNITALGIAVFKAVLVILFFMHAKYSSRLTWVVVIAAAFWLGILLFLTMSDYMTRGWLPVV